MSNSQQRVDVYNAYPGKKWKDRVNKMSDAQVLAIHTKMMNKPKKEHWEK